MSNLSRRFLLGAGLAALIVPSVAKSAYLPFTKPLWNALDYGVAGNGSTNDATAINTLFTNANTAGAGIYFPGQRTYELSSSTLSVPDGSLVIASNTATLRRSTDPGTGGSWQTTYGSYTGAMINLGNRVEWVGGILSNTAILGTSTTSNSMGTGSKNFTVAAGLNIGVGNFLRVESAGAPVNHMEGTVTSYTGTTLTINMAFFGGSGTFTDWNIFAGAVWQCPMVLHNVSKTNVSNVRVTGNWYVGMLMEAWNQSGAALSTFFCSFKDCYAEGVLNRGFYTYGNVNNCFMNGCYVQGQSGRTDYGFNMNPSTTGGATNGQARNIWANCQVESVGYQGFAIGDLMSFNIIHNCQVNSVLNSAGIGILVQTANGSTPTYNTISSCYINNAVSSGIGLFGTTYCKVQNNTVISSGIGILVTAGAGPVNSAECSLENNLTTSNTTGISIAASQANTLITGRSTANTTNLSDSGSGTVSTGLVLT